MLNKMPPTVQTPYRYCQFAMQEVIHLVSLFSGLTDVIDRQEGILLHEKGLANATMQGGTLLDGSTLTGYKRKSAETESSGIEDIGATAEASELAEGFHAGLAPAPGPHVDEDIVMSSSEPDGTLAGSGSGNVSHGHDNQAEAAAAAASVGPSGVIPNAASVDSGGNWGATNDPFIRALNRMIGPRGGVHNEKHLPALERMFEVRNEECLSFTSLIRA